jgi:hypothetical protein
MTWLKIGGLFGGRTTERVMEKGEDDRAEYDRNTSYIHMKIAEVHYMLWK